MCHLTSINCLCAVKSDWYFNVENLKVWTIDVTLNLISFDFLMHKSPVQRGRRNCQVATVHVFQAAVSYFLKKNLGSILGPIRVSSLVLGCIFTAHLITIDETSL